MHDINKHKQKSEPYGDFVDQTIWKFNENLTNNKDPKTQIEND